VLGLMVGREVGAVDGDELGMDDGAIDGLLVGTTVGVSEGEEVGQREGEVLGSVVGKELGLLEGNSTSYRAIVIDEKTKNKVCYVYLITN